VQFCHLQRNYVIIRNACNIRNEEINKKTDKKQEQIGYTTNNVKHNCKQFFNPQYLLFRPTILSQ